MPVDSELNLSAYKEIVAGSQDRSLEVFATRKFVARLSIDLNRHASPCAHDEPSQYHSADVYDTRMSQPPMSPVRNDQYEEEETEGGDYEGDEAEHGLRENEVGDVEANCLEEDMDHDLPYLRSHASDSEDEGPDEDVNEDGLTAKEAAAHKKVVGRAHRPSLFRDLSLANKAIVDGGISRVLEPRASAKKDRKPKKYGINPGVKFQGLLEFQMWIKDYAVKYHRPYKVVHSDAKVRYTVKCEDKGCSWVVRARPFRGGPQWSIVTCQSIHTCSGKDIRDTTVADDHRQLSSAFIAYRVANNIKSPPTYTIKGVIDLINELFGYKVKYGKTWKAKQAAFKILYGDWEEAYNRLPRLLGAMAARNPGTYHVVEPLGTKTRTMKGESVRVFGRAFWAFGPSIRAFKHCRPVMSVDGTFLTGRFKGTMLVAIGHDAANQLLPLAFALVTVENNDNWEWFMHLVRTNVIEPNREVCVISDRHQGILNAVEKEIPGCARVHHRWCMRHFVSNFYRACGNKEHADDLQDCCLAFTARHFTKLYNRLYGLTNDGGKEFLRRNMTERPKWARAYDYGMSSGGWRNYGKKVSVVEKVKNKWEVPEIPSWEQLQYRKRYAEATRKMEEEKAEWARERAERNREDANKFFKKLMDDYDLKRKKMIEDDKKAKEWELEREKDRLAREKAAEEDARKRKGKYGRCTQQTIYHFHARTCCKPYDFVPIISVNFCARNLL
ncbi:hypothetical protein ACQ4PT_039603 [Festuca glaucescens]